ncbi:MAG: alpha/beta fold hydrolase [Gammaproteobacteria bacterium]
MTLRRGLILGYLALLVVSNVYRASHDVSAPATLARAAGMQVVSIRPAGDQSIDVAFREYGAADRPTVIALHGSPATSGFGNIAPGLAQNYRVIVPHLPGFGASDWRLHDYSIAAHAQHIDALMTALNIESAHLVGYSMGGGVALELYDRDPQRVRSLSMVSAIGVQELEMFGSYQLNHVVHGLQVGAFLALEWGLPHFGALDRFMLNSRYARNFYDTDQRPLRGILQRFEPPLLIVHGVDDGLVPVAAAREHYRIVPHSELDELDGGHGLVFRQPERVLLPLRTFLAAVENGTAPGRADASVERAALAGEPMADHLQLKLTGLALGLALITLALSTLISEDAACIGAGFLVAGGQIAFWPATVACLVGIYVGDALLFFLGRHLGAPALHRAPMRWMVNSAGIDTAKAWFQRRGALAILISRFVPGTRFPTYVAAGALGLSFLHFSGWFLLAAVLWTPILVALSAAAGSAIWASFDAFSQYALPVLFSAVLGLVIAVRLVLPLTNHRGRRLLLGRWRRLTRWEFWPRWAFYPPLIAYVLWLGWRFRSLTVFTAANPAMPDGGFIGESKNAILNALAAHQPQNVARHALLPDNVTAEVRHAAVIEFMDVNKLDWPIVLKPDVGERGADVAICRTPDAVRDYLQAHTSDTLVQAFAPGHEFGVFYIREPDQKHGFIFAITDKRPPVVTGDGSKTLERLILDDDRAVCMAPTFLDRHAAHLFDVPKAGDTIELIDIGTHSRGCAFFDGEWVRTAQLEKAIDELSSGYAGFHFGRYDIRTPDVDAFQRGEAFQVVELNGVTSEATNIYDPSNSLLDAYRTLARQWRLAFEVGAANRMAGAAVTPAWALLRRALRA